jgi:addiction module HigA family antidote
MMKRPVHPGTVLADELEELDLSASALARAIKVPPNRITQILNGERSITGDTALRLGHWFNMNPVFWLNLQSNFDLNLARQAVGEEVEALPRQAI